MKNSLLFFLILFLFIACNKEQRTADKLVGKWQISTLKWANDSAVDVTNDKHILEFLNCDQAYTASCSGVYFLDYADTLKKDLNDTFKFELTLPCFFIRSCQSETDKFQFVDSCPKESGRAPMALCTVVAHE